MEFIKKNWKLLVLAILFFLALYFWQWFIIIVISLIIAYLLAPLIEWMSRIKINRTLSIIAVLLLLFFLTYLLLVNLIPLLFNQIKKLNSVMPSYIEQLKSITVAIKEKTLHLKLEDTDIANLIISKIQSIITFITQTTVNILLFFISYIPYLILIPIIVFYFLKDKDIFLDSVFNFFNLDKNGYTKLHNIHHTIMKYINGTLLDSLLMGIIFSVIFYIFKLKYALLLGGIAGLFTLIPYIGPILGVIPALIVYIIQINDWNQILLFIIFVSVIELLNGYLLQPKIIGGSIHFHPLVVLFIIIIGAGLLGGIGLFISIPIAIILRESIRGIIESKS